MSPFLAAALLALCPAPAGDEPGFRPLFDGKSLSGWVTRGGRYDGAARWTVEDGCLVGRQGPSGEGGLLYTDKPYASFELRLETKLDFPFDSGVFVRMVPPERELKGAQVTLDWHDDGEIGAIYADGFLQHCEAGKAKFKKDEWNDLRVRCTGFDMRLEFWLNGEKLTDFQQPADAPGYAPTGLIGVQVHGGRDDTGTARFRNLRIRELPLFGEELFQADAKGLLAPTKAASELGWKSLYDGKSLAGWDVEGDKDRFRFADGTLAFLSKGGGGHILTQADYQDFQLRLDFRIARMANSGLFLRAARDGTNPAFSGLEVQILDDFNWEAGTNSHLKPWQFTGSLYGSVPPGDRSAVHPLGEWNTYEVLYHGSRLAVALNGKTLYDVDTLALKPESGDPFEKRAKTGFIGLQHHGAETVSEEPMIAFRNLFVRKL